MKIKTTITICFLIAIILRALYLLTPVLNSDYANIGLAARHILKGEFPLFFYGDFFEGVIEGYLAAPFFFFFGANRLVLDCVPALVSLILIYATYKLAQTIFGNPTARLTLLFSCLAPPFFLQMTTVPMEGYIETTLLGCAAFIITYKIIYGAPSNRYAHMGQHPERALISGCKPGVFSRRDKPKNLSRLYFLLGLIIGFCLYLQFHIVPFAMTIGILLFLNDKKIILKKDFFIAILGFLIGNSPLLIYNLTHKFATFKLIGRGLESSTFTGTLKHLLGYGYWVILGARAEYAPANYIPYVSSLILFIYLGSFIYFIIKRKPGSELLIIFLLIFPITYWISGRGEVNTRRYLFPLYSVVFIVLAYGINAIKEKNKILFYALISLILASNLYANCNSIPFLNPESRKDYQLELLHDKNLYSFLKENNIKGVYTLSWWVSLRLNFDFEEDIIFAMTIDEPYPKYLKIVEAQPNPAVLSYYSEYAPSLDCIGGSYKTKVIAPPKFGFQPYSVLYDLTPAQQTLYEIDNSKWSAKTSHNKKAALFAFDRDIYTRWHSDTAQRKDMSFTIDLGKPYPDVTRICYHPGPSTDCPDGYELYASINGKNWQCVAKNHSFIMPVFWDGPHPFFRSPNGLIQLDFPPQTIRYLKIVLINDKDPWYWSIAEAYVYQQKDKKPKDWDIEKLLKRLKELKPKKIFADPWVMSHLDMKFYPLGDTRTIYDIYIYRHFIIKRRHLKNCIFVVLEENYPSFLNQAKDFNFIIEDFGPYKLAIFDEKNDNPYTLYWDGFHLLKCKY